jgi:hypothetical protein
LSLQLWKKLKKMRKSSFMKKSALLSIITILLTSAVFAQKGVAPAPTFAKYRVKVTKAKPKPVNLRSHKEARTFRTRLREANKRGVNFAGHYIIATWGCGTGCLYGAVINTLNGRVYFPGELKGVGAGFGELSDTDLLQYRKNSRLLIVSGYTGGTAESDSPEYGVSYLLWQGTKFKRTKFVKKNEDPQ